MRRFSALIVTSSFLGTLACAQPQTPAPRYSVTDLGTFGGTFSIAYSINSAGRVAGSANLPGENGHPFLSGIVKYDLGTLGGPNAEPGGPNGKDEMSILSETSKPDPLGEDFCGFGNHLICLAGFWNGTMSALPTLGGNNAMGFFINNRGQIIGVAENSTKDKDCPSPQVLDYQAAVWDQTTGGVQALPSLPGDTVGLALGVNDLGQVVGISGTCANTVVTAVGLLNGPHAVLWENGTATNLGSLGGTMNKAGAINSRGEVAGLSSLPGDTAVHSFLWTKDGGMQDLGALGTDFLGDPAGINNSTQIVGGSCDLDGNCRGFLWEKRVMTDLNSLIAADSPLYLMYGLGINDTGEIVGFALQKSTGEVHAYLAQPIHTPAGAHVVATPPLAEARPMALPQKVREILRQRMPRPR